MNTPETPREDSSNHMPQLPHRSLRSYRWDIINESTEDSLIERILEKRGIQKLDVSVNDLHSPFELPDMDKAVKRILEAFANNERIMIYGDYDVDGTTAAALLLQNLRAAGGTEKRDLISYRLPSRKKHGYGLNKDFIEECAGLNVKVIITADTGTTAVEEAALAKEKGISLIVTDHHLPPGELPDAFALINPQLSDSNYPNKGLCGTAVAWKLTQAVLEKSGVDPNFAYESLDLVALSTVCDCVPLVGENRSIVSLGVEKMRNTTNPGLKALIDACGIEQKNLDAYHLGYVIGPCINAAGRLQDPDIALRVLIGQPKYAQALKDLNAARKLLTDTIMEEAEAMLATEWDGKHPLIFLYKEDWNLGIVGLIAGRLAEKHHVPAIIAGGKDGEYTASCRSIPEVNIKDMLDTCADLMQRYGGHSQAAGFTVSAENIERLKRELGMSIEGFVKDMDLSKELRIDAEILPHEVSWETLEDLKKLAPFGIGNPKPRLIFKNVTIEELRAIGQTQEHLKLSLRPNDPDCRNLNAIAFRFAEHLEALQEATRVHVAGTLEENEWRDTKSLQFKVEDIAIAEE